MERVLERYRAISPVFIEYWLAYYMGRVWLQLRRVLRPHRLVRYVIIRL